MFLFFCTGYACVLLLSSYAISISFTRLFHEFMSRSEHPQYLIGKTGYSGIYPPFHNPAEFIWIKDIEQNWKAIREELFENAQFNTMNAPHIKGEGGWKAIYLINFTWTKHAICKKFPTTMKTLKAVPHLTFAAFSLLEPGASLQPHWGDTNTVIRCALGLEVPAEAPVCALKVADEVGSWEEGKVIMFSECHLHTAWNNSDKRRIVLSFDTMRPEYAAHKNWICARVLSGETLFFLTQGFKAFALAANYFYTLFYGVAAVAWYVYLPLQRRLKFLP
jgi:hypothetical protein